MSSALTIFFRNLEYDWKEEENQQRDNEKDHSKNHHLLFMPEQVTNDGGNEQANDRDDDANTEEDSSSTSSDSSSSTTSTTKSVPLSAFHIQIVSDNASSNCSQNQSHSAGNQSISQGLLLPKRRHSTPARPSPNDCGPRRPRDQSYHSRRSSSSGSLLVYHLPSQKHSSWKTFDLYEKGHDDFLHYDSALAPPSSSSSCSPHYRVGGGSSCSSRLTSRWHSGDQLLPAQTKSPLVQPIRRNTSRDDILVQSSDSNDDDVCGAGGKSHTLHTFVRCQCSKHSHNNNNDLAGRLSASSSSSLCHPVGGGGNVRSDKFAL